MRLADTFCIDAIMRIIDARYFWAILY